MLSALESPATATNFKALKFDDFKDEEEDLPIEPLLVENSKRFVLFPIMYHDIWNHYKDCYAKFWTAEDIEYSDDVDDFVKLSGKSQALVLYIAALFAMDETLVGENLIAKLSRDIQSPEARCFFGFQMMQRNIHKEAFTLGLGLLAKDKQDDVIEGMLESIISLTVVESIKKKTAWVQRHISDTKDHFSMRLISLAVYTQVFMTAIFSLVFHFGKDELVLPGLVHAAAKMRSDFESYLQAIMLIRKDIINKPSQGSVHAMVRGAVKVEQTFLVDLAHLCGSLELLAPIDTSAINLRIEHVADMTLSRLGYDPLFKTKDPMPWISVFADKEAKKHDVQEHIKTKVVAGGQALDAAALFSVDEDF